MDSIDLLNTPDDSDDNNDTDDMVKFKGYDLDEVLEYSLVEGTDNIYMKETKYILHIENLENSTYEVQEYKPVVYPPTVYGNNLV